VCWLIYNATMLDDNDFRKHADSALGSLKQSLITAEESADIEVEDQAGALHVSFDDGSRFVISPNAPVRQIWISALSTSFRLAENRGRTKTAGSALDQSAIRRRGSHDVKRIAGERLRPLSAPRW
jgi:iron donor protein CyaY